MHGNQRLLRGSHQRCSDGWDYLHVLHDSRLCRKGCTAAVCSQPNAISVGPLSYHVPERLGISGEQQVSMPSQWDSSCYEIKVHVPCNNHKLEDLQFDERHRLVELTGIRVQRSQGVSDCIHKPSPTRLNSRFSACRVLIQLLLQVPADCHPTAWAWRRIQEAVVKFVAKGWNYCHHHAPAYQAVGAYQIWCDGTNDATCVCSKAGENKTTPWGGK